MSIICIGCQLSIKEWFVDRLIAQPLHQRGRTYAASTGNRSHAQCVLLIEGLQLSKATHQRNRAGGTNRVAAGNAAALWVDLSGLQAKGFAKGQTLHGKCVMQL